jgi:hypothetical protein
MEVTMTREFSLAIVSIFLMTSSVAYAQNAPSVTATSNEWRPGVLFPPAPRITKTLFHPIAEARDSACPRKEEVIQHYIFSESDLKSGNVKLLAGDLPQLFSDRWRLRLHIPTMPVSAVVAQPLDLSPLGGVESMDVTEFDAKGCAFSRTLMSAETWTEILRAAAGLNV